MSDWYRESRDVPSETQDQQDAPTPLSPSGQRAMQGDYSPPAEPPGPPEPPQPAEPAEPPEPADPPETPQPAEPPEYHQPPADGERAMDERAETGPEKMDKEWYPSGGERGW